MNWQTGAIVNCSVRYNNGKGDPWRGESSVALRGKLEAVIHFGAKSVKGAPILSPCRG